MFKKLALVLAAASCVALSGCGEEKSQSAPAAPQKAASAVTLAVISREANGSTLFFMMK